MRNHHVYWLLRHWRDNRHGVQWALATITRTEGSSYRKTGAMMLVNSLGQTFGMLSGGCLEPHILHAAMRCFELGEAQTLTFASREDDDLGWQLGCGGTVYILLQPICEHNQYLCLDAVLARLESNQACHYRVDPRHPAANQLCDSLGQRSSPDTILLSPPWRLGVFGAGTDAEPLLAMADQLGWRTWLFESRQQLARANRFPARTQIIHDWQQSTCLPTLHAAVIKHHHLPLDAAALSRVSHLALAYVGLLGPRHRTEKVLAQAQLHPDFDPGQIHSPLGLNIGGELPESVALSALSHIHAQLHNPGAKL